MAGLSWDSVQDQVGAGGCAYEGVIKAIVNVLVDKTVVVAADVIQAVDDAVKSVDPVPVVLEKGM
jgi:hypothetical protein